MSFAAFFDDAAIFPPGDASMAAAVAAHLARRALPDGRYVGPFVCSAARLGELAAALGDELLDVAIVGTPPRTAPAGITVVAIELSGPVTSVPAHPRVFVERSWDEPLDVPDGAMLKLRCGGAHVPSSCQLGEAIAHCVRNRVPFKLTAGLHHAVRTSGEHGFVNVLAAVWAAMEGSDPVPLLLEDDPEALEIGDLAAVRELFCSIGTCSIDEPLTDLRALGLVA
ncbi:MAG: hypothetical protein ABWX74_11855 [Aeromicrobium sp.]